MNVLLHRRQIQYEQFRVHEQGDVRVFVSVSDLSVSRRPVEACRGYSSD